MIFWSLDIRRVHIEIFGFWLLRFAVINEDACRVWHDWGLHSQETQCSFRRKIWESQEKASIFSPFNLVALEKHSTTVLFFQSVHITIAWFTQEIEAMFLSLSPSHPALPLSTGHPVTVGSVVPFYILLQKIMLMSFSLCTAPLTFFWPIDLVLVSLISIRQAETVAGLGEAHSESRDGHIGPRPHPIRKV